MVHALHPRVAIMNDGTRKGGEPDTMQRALLAGPRRSLADAFFTAERAGVHPAGNVHRQSARRAARPHAGGADAAPPPGPDAPPPPAHNGTAYWIKLSAQPDGTFTVTNTRNGFSKTYAASAGAK